MREKVLIFLDLFFILVFITLGLMIKADYSIILAYVSIVPYLILTKREWMIRQFIAASVIAVIWIMIAHDQYGYNRSFLSFNNIVLFPLFAWACGLFASYVIYSHYQRFFMKKGLPFKLLMYLILYWPLLITMETVAYHLFDIRNEATAHCTGLPILDCMHAPVWMQISYFSLGPIFFIIAMLIDDMERNKKDSGRDRSAVRKAR